MWLRAFSPENLKCFLVAGGADAAPGAEGGGHHGAPEADAPEGQGHAHPASSIRGRP